MANSNAILFTPHLLKPITMKKALKLIGITIGSIVALAAIALLFIGFNDVPRYDVNLPDYTHESSPRAVARGEKLTMMLCAGCHMNYETGRLTGKRMSDAPPEFGTIYSPNITQDKTYGIGEWTDAELLYLLRTGIKRDGQYAPPYMAKLPKMADEDLNAIIAYLHSDADAVSPDPTPDQASEPSLLTKALCRGPFQPFDYPQERIPMPDAANEIELGKYLAINLDCFSCHSADFKTNNFLEPEKSPGYFAGGNMPLNMEGEVVYTSNLTPHPETGIGLWTKEQFINAVKYGRVEGEPALQYPMMPYPQLSDAEAGAIYAYLMTIPAIENKVERSGD
jgi:mono/diheme cytochrome c family protein